MAQITASVSDTPANRDTPKFLAENFSALLADADAEPFLRFLGTKRFLFGARRRYAHMLFTAVCTGLWRLALRRTFPDCWQDAYEEYIRSLWASMKDADAYVVFVRDVSAVLPEHGSDDFTPAACELLKRAGKTEDAVSVTGLALCLRRLYEYFFNYIA